MTAHFQDSLRACSNPRRNQAEESDVVEPGAESTHARVIVLPGYDVTHHLPLGSRNHVVAASASGWVMSCFFQICEFGGTEPVTALTSAGRTSAQTDSLSTACPESRAPTASATKAAGQSIRIIEILIPKTTGVGDVDVFSSPCPTEADQPASFGGELPEHDRYGQAPAHQLDGVEAQNDGRRLAQELIAGRCQNLRQRQGIFLAPRPEFTSPCFLELDHSPRECQTRYSTVRSWAGRTSSTSLSSRPQGEDEQAIAEGDVERPREIEFDHQLHVVAVANLDIPEWTVGHSLLQ